MCARNFPYWRCKSDLHKHRPSGSIGRTAFQPQKHNGLGKTQTPPHCTTTREVRCREKESGKAQSNLLLLVIVFPAFFPISVFPNSSRSVEICSSRSFTDVINDFCSQTNMKQWILLFQCCFIAFNILCSSLNLIGWGWLMEGVSGGGLQSGINRWKKAPPTWNKTT